MKTNHKYLMAACAILLATACGKKADENTTSTDSTAVSQNSTKAEEAAPTSEAEVLPENESEWEVITKWEVSITAATSLMGVVSKEEAEQIEQNGDGERWVEYDEEEDQYVVHGFDEIVQSSVTVTNPKHVKMLNQMMEDPKYSDYVSDVKISGTTAYAKWYGGNRGGGIEEDFPKEVQKFLGY